MEDNSRLFNASSDADASEDAGSDTVNADAEKNNAEGSTPAAEQSAGNDADSNAAAAGGRGEMSDEEAEKKYRPYIGGRNVTEPNSTSYYKKYVEENETRLDEESARPDHGYRNRWTSLIILVVIIALYMLYSMVLKDNVSCAGDEVKSKLEGEVDAVGYVSTWESDGEDGWTASSGTSAWTEDVENLVYIMDDFYAMTGVRAYILDLSNEDVMTADELQAAADGFYAETFEDERHFLIAFQSTSDALAAYHAGTEAAEIMDEEAIEIFDDNLDNYFGNDSYDESDVLIYVFSDSENTIMNGNSRTMLLIIVIIIMLIYGIYASYKNLRKGSGSSRSDARSR